MKSNDYVLIQLLKPGALLRAQNAANGALKFNGQSIALIEARYRFFRSCCGEPLAAEGRVCSREMSRGKCSYERELSCKHGTADDFGKFLRACSWGLSSARHVH